MDREALRAHLAATFLGEIDEHVLSLEREALALERDPGPRRAEILRTLFRAAHSLKGAARSAGYPPIEAVCHRLEELLARARDGAAAPGPELAALVLAAADALGDAANRLRSTQDLASGHLGEVLERLEGAAAAKGDEAPARRAEIVAARDVTPPPSRDVTPPPSRDLAPPLSRDLAPGAPRSEPSRFEEVVRLPAARLDALVTRSGELYVARRRVAAQEEALGQLRDLAIRCAAEWRVLEKPLAKLGAAPAGSRSGGAVAASGALPRRAVLAAQRTRDGLRKLERGIEQFARRLAADQHQLDRAAAPLEIEVRRIRMLPFGEAAAPLERSIRELARAAGKEAELTVTGAAVEIDRVVLDRLRDPLLHLVRNAVDHGLEPPAERLSRGKPSAGRVALSATLRGTGVEIAVEDDGRGLDVDRIREQAARRGMAIPEDDAQLEQILFVPGFSTAPAVTALSGRGVGLDVVKHHVQALHGAVHVASEPGRGARFSLTVPLTLATMSALLLRAGGELFALPATNVRELRRCGEGDRRSAGGRRALLSGGRVVPVASLAETLGLPAEERAPEARGAPRGAAPIPFVVVASGGREVAFEVDELVDQQDIAVKSLGRRLRGVRFFSGATPLASGRLALILAAGDLVAAALERPAAATVAPPRPPQEAPPPTRRRLLVVDDSVTTRSLVKSILESAGYEVMTAPDGEAAWQLLQDRGADLVVADVEMPRMDGFALTETIRRSRRFAALPVILVTALASPDSQARGLEAGAHAYLPKSAFEQTALLEAIHRLT